MVYQKKSIIKNNEILNLKVWNSMLTNKENDIAFADITFDVNRLNNANFILGPASTEEDLNELKTLISKCLPGHKGKIQESKLLIRFKEK